MTVATSTLKTFDMCFLCCIAAAHCSQHRRKALMNTDVCSEGPHIEFDEEELPEIMDEEDDQAGGGEDPDNVDHNEDNVVNVGDASAAAASKEKSNNTVESEKSKRVDNDKRTTTPYMTKYERARVLGTRALQIRSVLNIGGL